MRHMLRMLAAAAAAGLFLFPAVHLSGSQRARGAQTERPAQPAARKFAKPDGGAMNLSVLRARIQMRRYAWPGGAYVPEVHRDGVVFRYRAGSSEIKPFLPTGYCKDPQKVRGRPDTWIFPAFPRFAWTDKDEAKYFCQGWNRLVYAALSGAGTEEGVWPPGNAMNLTPGVARAIVRALIPKRHFVSREAYKLTGLDPEKTTRMLDAEIEFISDSGISVRYKQEQLTRQGSQLVPQQTEERASIPFAHGYVAPSREVSDEGPFWWCGEDYGWARYVFTWKNHGDARRFCDAVNRLVYNAAMGEADDPFRTFGAAAKTFRAGQRPEPPADLERRRVLAENAFQEKDYFAALEHYEAGLRAHQTWPEGWFNAALLYEALGEWEYAASRMSHYLELVPDAPDAQAAREKLIIWKEKMRR